jgi:hypothetical protein
MFDELPPAGTDLIAPRADFSGIRPLFWSAGYVLHQEYQLCRALVLPAQHLRLEFKPDTDQDAIHALQRELAFLLASAGLMGGYIDDEHYLVLSLLQPMQDSHGEALVNWLAKQTVVCLVRFSEVQTLAQLLANVAGGEFCSEQPRTTARLLTLMRLMNADWTLQRWSMSHTEADAAGGSPLEGGAL